MTVCPKCEGSGELRVPVTEHMGAVLYGTEQCDECGGSGYVNMTNEEWLKSLSTEELANYIATQCADAIRLWREMQYWTANEKCKSNKWYVWLKEIHE